MSKTESMDYLVEPKSKRYSRKAKNAFSWLGSQIKSGFDKYDEYNKPENRIKRLKNQLAETSLRAKIESKRTKILRQQNKQKNNMPTFGYEGADPYGNQSLFIRPNKRR